MCCVNNLTNSTMMKDTDMVQRAPLGHCEGEGSAVRFGNQLGGETTWTSRHGTKQALQSFSFTSCRPPVRSLSSLAVFPRRPKEGGCCAHDYMMASCLLHHSSSITPSPSSFFLPSSLSLHIHLHLFTSSTRVRPLATDVRTDA